MEECEDFYLEMEIGVKDITKFRPLRDGEDTLFKEVLPHLKRLDDCMTWIIITCWPLLTRECVNYGRVTRKEATLAQLIAWMNTEMKSSGQFNKEIALVVFTCVIFTCKV